MEAAYLSKLVETRNCYLAMWLPQLLMRHFIRNEASILGHEEETDCPDAADAG